MTLPITDEMRHHLEHEVEHFSHLLSSQGPMTTFIHHNTLHGLQHLPFEEAIAEATRILGGRGYLSNEEYRAFYRRGRIGDEDIEAALEARPALAGTEVIATIGERLITSGEVFRTHLLYGIDAIEPAQWRFEACEREACRRFRSDVPKDARAVLLSKAKTDLARSLDRIGRDWTLADWMQSHTNLDLIDGLREAVKSAIQANHGHHDDNQGSGQNLRHEGKPATPLSVPAVEHWLRKLQIPKERREGYLQCIDRHAEGIAREAGMGNEQLRRLWLRTETDFLKKLARLHFGCHGTYNAIASHFSNQPETYALSSLWNACLAVHGLHDPLAPTNPIHLQQQNADATAELLHERFWHLERWGGPPILLSPDLRADVQAFVDRELGQLEKSGASAVEVSLFLQFVLHDLETNELNRRGIDALEDLLSDRAGQTENQNLLEKLHTRDPRRQMMAFAQETLDAVMTRLGRDLSHSEFLRGMTGEHLSERINRYLIKRCAAFLDEGQSAWRMPDRTLGFYDAWRRMTAPDWSLDFADLADWGDALQRLPDKAEDAVIQQLQTLGVQEADWGEYLGRLLLQLSGWAGMISWRSGRPHYPRQEAMPIDLIQFLAVRLFLETLLVQQVCKENWNVEADLASLRHFFQNHQYEFFVRQELHAGKLPDYLAVKVRALLSKSPVENGALETLADMIWMHRQSSLSKDKAGPTVYRSAWRLFQLSQFLGLSGDDLRALSATDRERLLATLDAFPSSAHGPVWLTAYEFHYRDQILNALANNRGKGRWKTRKTRPLAQVVFCIDEREEAIHRHLEELSPGYETLGAAGFFGVAMNYSALDDHHTTPLCPPVITPAHHVDEVSRPDDLDSLQRHKRRHQWNEVFHNTDWELKRNSISAYFLLDLLGFFHVLPLFGRIFSPHRYTSFMENLRRHLIPPVRTSLTVDAPAKSDAPNAPKEEHLGFTNAEQADRVEAMLRNLGMTYNFARLAVFTGHGSVSVNNPHESAHDCGACGGKHGGPNGRAFAAMVNRPAVRAVLRERGIDIPDDTWFVGAQHNTASDLYTFYDVEDIPATHREDWRRLVADLDEARARSAQERCRRFASAPKDVSPRRSLRHVEERSMDLSQVRPEWGHATNAIGVVGRRSITYGVFLDRRPFIISYDPTQDPDGKILERILLAVGPVGAGINLEYYFSTVDNIKYGCDTKVPHNVMGLIGVMEGAMSDLRTGLPKQMVEIHEPMRLQLMVEAKLETLGEIYGRQKSIQELLGNAWVHLIAIDPDTGEFNLFHPRGEFILWDKPITPLPIVRSSFEWYKSKTDYLTPAMIVQNGEQTTPPEVQRV
ncbi:MAG: putative inorganic carbon transporter subunit DabA [Pyrinomonadaceae bacterium]